MKRQNYLLPNGLRPLVLILIFPGIFLLILRYQFNYKPDFLNLKMFAFYTYYIESKAFTVVKNQMIEEIAAILILAGMFILAFTREKTESEDLDAMRYKAFIFSSYLNLAFLIISLLFFFGFGFVGALTVFMGVWLLDYLLVLRYSLYSYNKTQPR